MCRHLPLLLLQRSFESASIVLSPAHRPQWAAACHRQSQYSRPLSVTLAARNQSSAQEIFNEQVEASNHSLGGFTSNHRTSQPGRARHVQQQRKAIGSGKALSLPGPISGSDCGPGARGYRLRGCVWRGRAVGRIARQTGLPSSAVAVNRTSREASTRVVGSVCLQQRRAEQSKRAPSIWRTRFGYYPLTYYLSLQAKANQRTPTAAKPLAA